jgi:hypothetical protein
MGLTKKLDKKEWKAREDTGRKYSGQYGSKYQTPWSILKDLEIAKADLNKTTPEPTVSFGDPNKYSEKNSAFAVMIPNTQGPADIVLDERLGNYGALGDLKHELQHVKESGSPWSSIPTKTHFKIKQSSEDWAHSYVDEAFKNQEKQDAFRKLKDLPTTNDALIEELLKNPDLMNKG